MFRAFIKDSVIYSIPTFITRGLSVFLVPLYTRVLSPADYGSLDLLSAFAGIVGLIITFEICQGLARFYIDESDPQGKVAYASSVLWFTVASYTVFGIIMLWLTPYVSGLIMGQPGLETAFQIGIGYICINRIFFIVQNQFRWEMRSRGYALVSILMVFVTAGVSVWLAYVWKWGLNGLLVGLASGSLVASLLGFWLLRKSFIFHFDTERTRKMLLFSAPLVFSGIAAWLSFYISRFAINYFLTVYEVGLYSIGLRVAYVITLVTIGFQVALTPLVYSNHEKADTPRQLERIFRIFMLFALLSFLFLSMFALDILKLATTPAFYDGAVLVVYLVPAVLLSQMFIFAPGILIAQKTKLILLINIIGACLNTMFNFVLIPLLGIQGAGIATLLGYLCMFILYMKFSQRFYPVPYEWGRILAALGIAVMFIVAVPYLASSEPMRWALNIGSLISFLVFCIPLGLVRVSELQQAGWALRNRFFPRSTPMG